MREFEEYYKTYKLINGTFIVKNKPTILLTSEKSVNHGIVKKLNAHSIITLTFTTHLFHTTTASFKKRKDYLGESRIYFSLKCASKWVTSVSG